MLNEFEFIGVLRHMQRYFSNICDGTDVQADWRRSCTYGRAPNAIDIPQGSLTCPSYTDMGPHFLVHLSRRLKCTIVIMRCPSVVVNFHIFVFSSEPNSTKLYRKLDLNVLYEVYVFRADRKKTRWPPWPLIGGDIFNFSSETTEQNSTKLDRKQDLNVLYQVCVFQADWKNRIAALASDWLRHFRLLLWTEFNETWQEARSQCPLPSFCFSSRSEN